MPESISVPESSEETGRLSVSTHESNDADDQACHLRGWLQHYDQISTGVYKGRTTDAHFEGMQIFREYSSNALRQKGLGPAGTHNFSICLKPGKIARFRASDFSPDTLLIIAAGTELDLCTPPDFEAFGVNVQADAFRSYAGTDEDWDLDRHLSRLDVCPLPEGYALQLCSMLQVMFRSLESCDPVWAHANTCRIFRGELIELLASVLRAPTERGHMRATAQQLTRIVKRAEEYIRFHGSRTVTIADLCQYSCSSRRRLQYAFREVMGISPNQYLKAVRLCEVRRELKAENPGHQRIQDIAARWGFWHLGHFARDYRGMFGELPSETTRAASQHLGQQCV